MPPTDHTIVCASLLPLPHKYHTTTGTVRFHRATATDHTPHHAPTGRHQQPTDHVSAWPTRSSPTNPQPTTPSTCRPPTTTACTTQSEPLQPPDHTLACTTRSALTNYTYYNRPLNLLLRPCSAPYSAPTTDLWNLVLYYFVGKLKFIVVCLFSRVRSSRHVCMRALVLTVGTTSPPVEGVPIKDGGKWISR